MDEPTRKSRSTRLTTSLQLQLDALTQGRGVLSKQLRHLLANELSDLRRFWELDLGDNLASLQKQVQKKLIEHFRRIPPYRNKASAEGDRREVFLRSFQLSFNIFLLPHEQLEKKNDRQRLVEELNRKGATFETAGRDMLFAYAEIERQILATGFQPRVPVSAFGSEQSNRKAPIRQEAGLASSAPDARLQDLGYGFMSAYVPRVAHATRLTRLCDKNVRLIGICGQPGTGKTRFALEESVRRGTVELIRFRHAAGDIAAILGSHGVSVPYDASLEFLVQSLVPLLRSSAAPNYLILDDFDTGELVVQLTVPRLNSHVLVTSQQQILPPNRGEYIIFDDMTDDEARVLAKASASDLSDSQIDWLVIYLGARPLAIEATCLGLLRDKIIPFGDLMKQLHYDVAGTLEGLPGDRNLPLIYENITASLRVTSERAALLLEIIAVVGNEDIPAELLRLSMTQALATEYGLIDLQADLNVLQHRCLLSVRNGNVSLPGLTQRILRERLGTAVGTKRSVSFLEAVNLVLAVDDVEHPISDIPRDILWHVVDAARNCVYIETSDIVRIRLYSIFVAIIRAICSLGHYREIAHYLRKSPLFCSALKSDLIQSIAMSVPSGQIIANLVATCELWENHYMAGNYTADVYLYTRDQIYTAMNSFLPSASFVRNDAKFLEAAKTLCDFGLLEAQIDGWTDAGYAIDLPTSAWLLCLQAEMDITKGDYEDAARGLLSSWHRYLDVDDQLTSLRGRARAYSAMCRLAVFGRLWIAEGGESVVFSTGKMGKRLTNEIEVKPDLLAVAHYVSGQVYILAYRMMQVEPLEDGRTVAQANESYFSEAVSNATMLYEMTGAARYIADLAYPHLMVALRQAGDRNLQMHPGEDKGSPVVLSAESSDTFNALVSRYYARAKSQGDHFNQHLIWCAEFKWKLVFGVVDECDLQYAKRVAIFLAGKTESEYWYVELNIMLCLGYWRLGRVDYNLVEQVRKSCVSLDHRDRLDALMRCLSGLPADSQKLIMDALAAF